jgi:hypothetical protein
MRIDVAAGIWFLELLAAGRLADFPRSPVAARTYSVRHLRAHPAEPTRKQQLLRGQRP